MKVYRIQDMNGVGPYRPEYYIQKIGRHNLATKRPEILEEPRIYKHYISLGSDYFKRQYIFGFTSLGSLRKWFGEFKTFLLDKNLIVAVYDSPDVISGSYQCVFSRQSKLIKTLSIQDSFKGIDFEEPKESEENSPAD